MNRGKKMVKTVRMIALLIGVGFALSACADADTAGYAYNPGYVYDAPDYGWFGFYQGGDWDHGWRHESHDEWHHGWNGHADHGGGHEGGFGGGHAGGFGGGHGGGFGGGFGGGHGGGGHGR